MANRSRLKVLNGEYRPSPKFAVPLVSSLHPATTILSQVVKSSFSAALSKDPVLEVILPPSSLIVAYTKLPNLQLLLCPNGQNKLAGQALPTQQRKPWLADGLTIRVTSITTMSSVPSHPILYGSTEEKIPNSLSQSRFFNQPLTWKRTKFLRKSGL